MQKQTILLDCLFRRLYWLRKGSWKEIPWSRAYLITILKLLGRAIIRCLGKSFRKVSWKNQCSAILYGSPTYYNTHKVILVMLKHVFYKIQALLHFIGYDFCNFQFNAVYYSIPFSSPLVLLSNLNLRWFFMCPHLESINRGMLVSVKTFL